MVYKGYTFDNQHELRNAIIMHQKKICVRIKKAKIVSLVLAELAGVLTIFFAVTTFTGYNDSFPTYERPSYEFYGGDAYTGIQNATADSANNIAEMGDILKNYIYDFSFTMGGILLIIGLLTILISSYQIFKTICSPIVLDKTLIEGIMEDILSQESYVVSISNHKGDGIE